MGQAHYTGIFWGAIVEFLEDMDHEAWYDAINRFEEDLTWSFDGANAWIGYWVADCGQDAAPHGMPSIAMEAFELTDLARTLHERFPDKMQAAATAYADLRVVSMRAGVPLPAGRVLLVNAYD